MTTDAEREERKRIRLARHLLQLAGDLRRARQRVVSLISSTRYDLAHYNAVSELRNNGKYWAEQLIELAARIALPRVKPRPQTPTEPPTEQPPEPPAPTA